MRGPRRRPLSIAAAIAAPIAAALAAAAWTRRRLFTVAVAGSSMAPAFEDGDYVLIVRRPLPPGEAAAGLVACVRGPDGRLLLKRVVGLPGDSLRVGREVAVAGRVLLEPYARGEAPPHSFRGVHALAPGEYLVLGDNRPASTDSRDFGPIRAEHVEGIAWLRYWPPERAGRVRRAPRRFRPPSPPGKSSGTHPGFRR